MPGFKLGPTVGGIGTVAGIAGVTILATQTPTTGQALRILSEEEEQIKAEKIKEIGITGLAAKTREDIETMKKEDLKTLAELKEFKEVDGKNNLCELIQREFVRKIIKENFKFVATSEDDDFAGFFNACVSPKTISRQ